MKLKINISYLILICCLSFLQLTAKALNLQLTGSPNGKQNILPPTSNQGPSTIVKDSLTTAKHSKFDIHTIESGKANWNKIYNGLKSNNIKSAVKIEGGVAAGGGSIFIYPDKQTGEIKAKTIEIYQITEENKNNFTLDTGSGNTLDQKLKYIFNRLKKVSGMHAEMYETWINEILNDPEASEDFNDVVGLPRVEDIGAAQIPKGGYPLQVFIQQIPGTPSLITNKINKRYLWNKKLFYSLDLDSQLALLFHEVIYRDYREINIKMNNNVTMSSQNVQYMTGLILSKDIEKYNFDHNDKSKYFYKDIHFSNLLKSLNLVKEQEELMLMNVDDEVKCFKNSISSFEYIDCESGQNKYTCGEQNKFWIYQPDLFLYRYCQNNKSNNQFIGEPESKSTLSHLCFQAKIKKRVNDNLQLNKPRKQSLDFIGINYTGVFGYKYFSRDIFSNSVSSIQTTLYNFIENLDVLDITELVNQVHGYDIGMQIYSYGNAKTVITYSGYEKQPNKTLNISGNEKLVFKLKNFLIEINVKINNLNIDLSESSNENRLSDNYKLKNISIYDSNNNILASNIYGIVDLNIKNKHQDPLDRFELYQIIQNQNLFSKNYTSKKMNLRELIKPN